MRMVSRGGIINRIYVAVQFETAMIYTKISAASILNSKKNRGNMNSLKNRGKNSKKNRGNMQTNHHPSPESKLGSLWWTYFILLVEPMFVLACLASLPGTPRRALDAAGLVLVWFGVCNAGSVEKTSTKPSRKPRGGRMQDVSVIVTY